MIYFHLLRTSQRKWEKYLKYLSCVLSSNIYYLGYTKSSSQLVEKKNTNRIEKLANSIKMFNHKQKNTFYLLAIQGMQIMFIR